MNEFELERELSRGEIAAYLRKLADGLEQDNKVTFVVGDESTTINPPEHAQVRMETNTDSSWLGSENGHSFVFELGWEAVEVDDDGDLTIITQPRSTRQSREAAADDETVVGDESAARDERDRREEGDRRDESDRRDETVSQD